MASLDSQSRYTPVSGHPESSANEQERGAGAAAGPNPLFYNLPGGGRGPLARTCEGRSLANGRVLELRA